MPINDTPLVTLELTIQHMRQQIISHLTHFQVPQLDEMIQAELRSFFESKRFQAEIADEVAKSVRQELDNQLRSAIRGVFWRDEIKHALADKLVNAIADELRH